jgi:hypothetical protein
MAARRPGSVPQFGQISTPSRAPKSLEEVLAERGFQIPEKPRAVSQDIAFLGTDPVTGKMRQGGSTLRPYYNKLDEMYAQNPEALEIAKQYTEDPSKFGGEKPTDRRSVLVGQLNQTAQPSTQPPLEMIQRPGGSVSSPAQIEVQQETQRRKPQPGTVQEFQPIQRPSFESLQQPMAQQQPQFTQQDMTGMMRLMMQMFQQMMQGGMGQQAYNSGAFSQAPSNYYPQFAAPQQSYRPPQATFFAPQRYQAPRPQPYRFRQASRFAGSPFGRN